MAAAEAHNMLLNYGIAAGVGLAARGHPAARVRVLAPGQDPHRLGGQRRAGRRRATAARLAAARAISTPPAQLLDQYIESAMGCLWLRMGPAMISQTPSSALPDCRPANPRGPARAKAPTAATASPEIRLTAAALPPAYCRVMTHGERATHSPVSMPSAAAAWAPTPRQVAGSRYPSDAPAAAGPAGTASADAPLPSGRRISGVFMTCSFLRLRQRAMTVAPRCS